VERIGLLLKIDQIASDLSKILPEPDQGCLGISKQTEKAPDAVSRLIILRRDKIMKKSGFILFTVLVGISTMVLGGCQSTPQEGASTPQSGEITFAPIQIEHIWADEAKAVKDLSPAFITAANQMLEAFNTVGPEKVSAKSGKAWADLCSNEMQKIMSKLPDPQEGDEYAFFNENEGKWLWSGDVFWSYFGRDFGAAHWPILQRAWND
jgi:hypothetical protein